jgi:toxin ParE1/3/4
MSRKHKIAYAESAVSDMTTMRAWYAEQGVPAEGERLTLGIFSRVERLAIYPRSGRIVPEFGVDRLREIIYPPFRIVYRLDTDCIRVVRIWRSERQFKLSE